MRHHLRPHRIQHHIAAEFQQVRLFLHQNRREPALQEMPYTRMPPVVRLRIPAIQLAHPEGEIWLRRFNEQMIMVVPQAWQSQP